MCLTGQGMVHGVNGGLCAGWAEGERVGAWESWRDERGGGTLPSFKAVSSGPSCCYEFLPPLAKKSPNLT